MNGDPSEVNITYYSAKITEHVFSSCFPYVWEEICLKDELAIDELNYFALQSWYNTDLFWKVDLFWGCNCSNLQGFYQHCFITLKAEVHSVKMIPSFAKQTFIDFLLIKFKSKLLWKH